MVADCTAADGWRMTGSAFARYERRGTLFIGWLRRINSFRKGGSLREGGGPIARDREAGGFMLGPKN